MDDVDKQCRRALSMNEQREKKKIQNMHEMEIET